MRVTMIEAREVLGSFDSSLRCASLLGKRLLTSNLRNFPSDQPPLLLLIKGNINSLPSTREYAARKLIQRGVELRKGAVKCMDESTITLQVETEGKNLGQMSRDAFSKLGLIFLYNLLDIPCVRGMSERERFGQFPACSPFLISD